LQRSIEFVYGRKKEILIGVSVAAVLLAGFFTWRYFSARRDAAAQSMLSQVINAYNDTAKPEKERYERTIVEAQKTVDSYANRPVGRIAQYYMALSHEGLGDTAKSVENLQQVIGHGDETIKSVAQFALAGIYKKRGETQKAIDIYKQVYDAGGYSKAAVAFELASLYESISQPEQAKDFYQKLISEHPDSPFRQFADEALKRMGVTPVPPTTQNPS
jgi:tetratricopeptide (TPR) repeat protein